MSKSAIILGATGLTGGLLLQSLLKDERYNHIILFSRNTCGIKHPKLTEYIVDLFELEKHQDKFKADEVFCCIGTTKAKTSDKEIYKKIDYGIPVASASLCEQNEIDTFAVISALGANKESAVFYNRVKGEMEAAVLNFNIKNTYILQPSLISGERDEKRLGESIMNSVMSLTKPVISLFRLERFLPIHPQTIANCMVWLATHDYKSGRIESKTIQEIGVKK
jgi:uncharacterized protein YbjT (DUF2867 family)